MSGEVENFYVSTTLAHWKSADQTWAPVVILAGQVFVRLTPAYFLWFARQARGVLANQARTSMTPFAFWLLQTRLNEVTIWAQAHFSESELHSTEPEDPRPAITRLSALVTRSQAWVFRAVSPVTCPQPAGSARPVIPQTTPGPVWDVSERAVAQVRAIRDAAQRSGWSDEELFCNVGHLRQLGVEYGLVCYVGPHDTIGEVTRDHIELRRPSGSVLRFYKPPPKKNRRRS